MPTINGVNRSVLLDMSLSVPSFFAQYRMIAIGSIDVNISDIISNVRKSVKLCLNVNVKQIIRNNGMHIIGGLVIVEIFFAIFTLFMYLVIHFLILMIKCFSVNNLNEYCNIYLLDFNLRSYFFMKMEIELTDSQAQKVRTLQENDISVGDAIDILFEMKESIAAHSDKVVDERISKLTAEKAKLQEQIDKLDKEMSVFNKLKDTTLDVGQKLKIIEKDYGEIDDTYDKVVLDTKHKFKWSENLFKF